MTPETKKEMKKILEDIRSGAYARGWIEENRSGRRWFEQRRSEERAHAIEVVGADLRAVMPFLKPVTIRGEEVVGALVRQNG